MTRKSDFADDSGLIARCCWAFRGEPQGWRSGAARQPRGVQCLHALSRI